MNEGWEGERKAARDMWARKERRGLDGQPTRAD